MPIRTINSPGVEIRETDKSQIAAPVAGTSFLVMGFSDKGTEYDPMQVASLADFETNFGVPTNEAERYFYYAARDVLRSGSNLVAAKLPYKNDIAVNYKFFGLTIDGPASISASPVLSDMADMRGVSGYFPDVCEIEMSSVQNLPTSAYDSIIVGNGFTPSDFPALGSYHFIIVNENKARITGPSSNEGIFVVVVDPIDALKVQRSLVDSSDSDILSLVEGINQPSGNIEYENFIKPLTGTFVGQSISEDVARMFPDIPFNYRDGDVVLDKTYGRQIGLVVCQTRVDPNQNGKLTVSYLEAFVGSVMVGDKNPVTGQSMYIGDMVNTRSVYLRFYRNLINDPPVGLDEQAVLWMPDSYYQFLGFEEKECLKWIEGIYINNDIAVVLDKVSNVDDIRIDVVVDAGLSTIAQFCDIIIEAVCLLVHRGACVLFSGEQMYYRGDEPYIPQLWDQVGAFFDPIVDVVQGEVDSAAKVSIWRSVCDQLKSFCQDVRKDCMAIIDVPRNLVIHGTSKHVRTTKPENTFSNTIGPRLKYVSGIDSSYVALYANWMLMKDVFTGKPFWLPPTCKACGIYGFNDKIGNLWDAPAGLNRGIIDEITDLSFNPKTRDSDQIYAKGINYAKWYKSDGFILEGQKTTIAKPSAFDRVGVRRLFLRLERYARQTADYFVMEPNNATTRRRLVDVLTMAFDVIRAAGGLYAFQIVCDDSNNGNDVVNANELRCMIVMQATKTSEYVICDFIAVRTGQSGFTEIVAELT